MMVIAQRETRDMLSVLVERASQRSVAEELGVHYNTVYRWLHSDEIPRIAALAVRQLSVSMPGGGRL